MARTYRSTVHVRGYELDSFGHVNHAVYLNYMEHARWELLAEKGITLERMAEWKRWPIIAHVELDYLKPTHMGDELDIHSSVVSTGKTHFVVEQVILRGDTEVLRGKVTIVTINEKGRPAELTPEMRTIWMEDPEGSAD